MLQHLASLTFFRSITDDSSSPFIPRVSEVHFRDFKDSFSVSECEFVSLCVSLHGRVGYFCVHLCMHACVCVYGYGFVSVCLYVCVYRCAGMCGSVHLCACLCETSVCLLFYSMPLEKLAPLDSFSKLFCKCFFFHIVNMNDNQHHFQVTNH